MSAEAYSLDSLVETLDTSLLASELGSRLRRRCEISLNRKLTESLGASGATVWLLHYSDETDGYKFAILKASFDRSDLSREQEGYELLGGSHLAEYRPVFHELLGALPSFPSEFAVLISCFATEKSTREMAPLGLILGEEAGGGVTAIRALIRALTLPLQTRSSQRVLKAVEHLDGTAPAGLLSKLRDWAFWRRAGIDPAAERIVLGTRVCINAVNALSKPERWSPGTFPACHTPIHGDLNENNVLVSRGAEFRLIDFEKAHVGLPQYDLAFLFLRLLNNLALCSPLNTKPIETAHALAGQFSSSGSNRRVVDLHSSLQAARVPVEEIYYRMSDLVDTKYYSDEDLEKASALALSVASISLCYYLMRARARGEESEHAGSAETFLLAFSCRMIEASNLVRGSEAEPFHYSAHGVSAPPEPTEAGGQVESRRRLEPVQLVGLDSQERQLRTKINAWATGLDAKPIVVLGEIGTGKSTLIDSCLSEVDAKVLRVSGVDYRRGELRITTSILAQLFDIDSNHDGEVIAALERLCTNKSLVSPLQLVALLRRERVAWLQRGNRKPRTREGSVEDGETTDTIASDPFAELWQVISVVGEEERLVLWLEDAHELVGTDLLPTMLTSAQAGSQRVQLIVELRAEADYKQARFRARYKKGGTFVITCRNLSRKATEVLAASLLGVEKREVPKAVRELLYEVSGGNPKFVTDFVQYLREQEHIRGAGSDLVFEVPPRLDPPEELSDIALARLRTMDLKDQESKTLVLLALAPHAYVSVDLICKTLGESSREGVLNLISKPGLLRESDEIEDCEWRVRLEHETWRSACRRLLDSQEPSFATELHAQVVAAYDRALGGSKRGLSTLRMIAGQLAEHVGFIGQSAPHLVPRILGCRKEQIAELREWVRRLRREPSELTNVLRDFALARVLDFESQGAAAGLGERYMQVASRSSVFSSWRDPIVQRDYLLLLVQSYIRAATLEEKLVGEACKGIIDLQHTIRKSAPDEAAGIGGAVFVGQTFCNGMRHMGLAVYKELRALDSANTTRDSCLRTALACSARALLPLEAKEILEGLDSDFSTFLSAMGSGVALSTRQLLSRVFSIQIVRAQQAVLDRVDTTPKEMKDVLDICIRLSDLLLSDPGQHSSVKSGWLRERICRHVTELTRRHHFDLAEDALAEWVLRSEEDALVAASLAGLLALRMGKAWDHAGFERQLEGRATAEGLSPFDMETAFNCLAGLHPEPSDVVRHALSMLLVGDTVVHDSASFLKRLSILESLAFRTDWDLESCYSVLASRHARTAYERIACETSRITMVVTRSRNSAGGDALRQIESLLERVESELRGRAHAKALEALVRLHYRASSLLPHWDDSNEKAWRESLRHLTQFLAAVPSARTALWQKEARWRLLALLGRASEARDDALVQAEGSEASIRGFYLAQAAALAAPRVLLFGDGVDSPEAWQAALKIARRLQLEAFDTYDRLGAAEAIGKLSLRATSEVSQDLLRMVRETLSRFLVESQYLEACRLLAVLGPLEFQAGNHSQALEMFDKLVDFGRRGVVFASPADLLENEVRAGFVHLALAESDADYTRCAERFRVVLSAGDKHSEWRREPARYNLGISLLALSKDHVALQALTELSRGSRFKDPSANCIFLHIYDGSGRLGTTKDISIELASCLSAHTRLVELGEEARAQEIAVRMTQCLPEPGDMPIDRLERVLAVMERHRPVIPPPGFLDRAVTVLPIISPGRTRALRLKGRQPPHKVDRNSRCLCGSGLKFKKCCGR